MALGLVSDALGQGGPPPPPSDPPGNGGTPPPQTIPDTNWKLSPLFSGTTSWTTVDQYHPPYLKVKSWGDMNHNVGYSSRLAYWAFDQRGTVFINYMDGRVASGGSLDFYLDYLGPYVPPNLRSFWTLSASGAASTDWTGTASATSSPTKTSSQGYGTASSSGTKVVEMTGSSGTLHISFSGQAFQPKDYNGSPLAQLAGSLRAHPHPVFALNGAEPGNRSRASANTRDGSQNGKLDVSVAWQNFDPNNPFPVGWYANYGYTFSQDLYSHPSVDISGVGNQGWIGDGSHWGYGSLVKSFGNDSSSSALGVTSNVVASLKDADSSSNPTVDIKTDIRWHKPVENPIEVPGTRLIVARSCQIVEKQPSGATPPFKPFPTNINDRLHVRYVRPGEEPELSPEIQRLLGVLGSEISGKIPGLLLVKEYADMDAFPKDQNKDPSFTTVFNAKWLNYTDQHLMGLGIVKPNEPENHLLEDIIGVYIWYTKGVWDVETYGATGYLGQGKIATFKEHASESYQGRFRYIDPNTPAPPPGTGGPGPGGPGQPGTAGGF